MLCNLKYHDANIHDFTRYARISGFNMTFLVGTPLKFIIPVEIAHDELWELSPMARFLVGISKIAYKIKDHAYNRCIARPDAIFF